MDQPVAAAPAVEQELPEHLQDALRQLIVQAEADNRLARAEEVKRCQRQREYFRGNQNIFWAEQIGRWSRITEAGGLGLPQELPESEIRYDYVENLYRVESLLHIAMLRQNPPKCQFRPQSFDQPEDVATARAAKDAMELVVHNNRLEKRMAEAIWYLDHDGTCMSYTYWEKSKELYGADWTPAPTQPVEREITPNRFMCPECSGDVPAAMDEAGVPAPPVDGCPGCASPVPMESFQPAVMGMVDEPMGDPEEVPRGQERALFMGALEVARPFHARDLRSCGWITWEAEVDKAWIKTLYPELEDKPLDATSGGGDNQEARDARVALMSTSWGRYGTDAHSSLVTFRRTWLRPWYFNTLKDPEVRRALVQRFPKGCFVAFAGDSYCESREEQIEKRWAWVPAYPGDGMMRDGWLTDYLDMQRKINTGENLKFETFERGLGTRFIDGKAVDMDAYIDQGAQAVNEMEITLRPGEKASDKIYDSAPAAVSPQLIADLDSMRMSRSEKLTGNFAAAYGGDTGPNDTARGIVEVKDSAMGRMSYFKEILNELFAETVMNLIRCLREHRTKDVKYAIEGPTGELDSKLIKLDQLRGNCYAVTDTEDAYPVTPAQKRAVILQILNGPPSMLQEAMFSPENYDMVRWAVGADMKMPGEQARRKQMREIELMKQGIPVPVDAMLDQHDYEIGALNEWGSSEDGQAAPPEVRMLAAEHMTQHLMGKAAVDKIVAGLAPQPTMQEGGEPAGEALPA